MKIVINSQVGGFGLSDDAFEMLLNMKNIPFEKKADSGAFGYTNYYNAGHVGEAAHFLWDRDFTMDEKRADPDLVKVVEELGDRANGQFASLKIVEIPDDVKWYIYGPDFGNESIHEVHRVWS